jgi:dihydroorotase
VVWRSTNRPAELIRRPELGTLTPGAEADVAVFELHERKPEARQRYAYMDCGRARLTGNYKLECRLTLRAGQVLFDPTGLTMPEWVDAPAPYWVNPSEK